MGRDCCVCVKSAVPCMCFHRCKAVCAYAVLRVVSRTDVFSKHMTFLLKFLVCCGRLRVVIGGQMPFNSYIFSHGDSFREDCCVFVAIVDTLRKHQLVCAIRTDTFFLWCILHFQLSILHFAIYRTQRSQHYKAVLLCGVDLELS